MSQKKRLDLLLVEKGLFETREKARSAIMAGQVYHQDRRLDKPGTQVPVHWEFALKGQPLPYVSRGGLKLEKAIRELGFEVRGHILIDMGASTGGFTDCALQHGAQLVYAVDVGYGQLAWKLREDPRVVVMERTNVRYLTPEMLRHGLPTRATVDLSFISLRLIFPVLRNILPEGGQVVALIKPQFEAGRERVGKKGIVRSPETHQLVLEEVLAHAAGHSLECRGLTHSPIRGGEGNIEFLAWLEHSGKQTIILPTREELADVVQQAHLELE